MLDQFSISEENGIKQISDTDLNIYSVGISTAGRAEKRMIADHPKRQVVATTIDPQGFKFAQKAVQSEDVSAQITIKLEDVSQPLPYKDGEFDFIYTSLD